MRLKLGDRFCAIALGGFLLGPTPVAAASVDLEAMARAEVLNGVPLDALRMDDAQHFQTSYAQGGDLIEQFIRLIFPISGREKRTMFLPLPFWGMKKPQYTKFVWKKYESPHFEFYAYPAGEATLATVIRYFEEEHERKNRIFGVENRFVKKIPVILYQSRRDFEQTTIIGGPIPEGLGGVTEIFSWKRVTFPFEGEEALLEHVAKHEGTHVYQIAKGSSRLPLWFIEGLAETLSISWDTESEMAIRDAYLNGVFFHLQDLWQIEGTWLMYKQGGFITNLIFEEYGEKGIRKIYENASSMNFEENLKESLGISVDQLDHKVFAALSRRFGKHLTRKDIFSDVAPLRQEEVLLHARNNYFLSGGTTGARNAIFLNGVGPGGKLIRKKVISDRRYGNESLDHFRKGAWMNGEHIIYGIKRSERDIVRVLPYQYDAKRKKFTLGKEQEFSWPTISSISSPVLIDENRLAFIGTSGGFTAVYLFDRDSRKLETISSGKRHLSGLDYSPQRQEVIFSAEDGLTTVPGRYDRNLYTLHVETKVETRLMGTPALREIQPQFSPNGQRVLYVADPDGTHDLFVYDFAAQETRRITRLRVGALNAHWGEEGSLLLNGFERLRPDIFRVRMPGESEILLAELPEGKGENVRPDKRGFLLAAKEAPKEVGKHSANGFYFENQNAYVRDSSQVYTVEKVARMKDRLVLSAKMGDAADKKVETDDQLRYFSLEGEALEGLWSTMIDRTLSPDLERRLVNRLEGRAIIRGWMDASGNRVLLLVNNRVAENPQPHKEKDDVGVLLFQSDDDSIRELEDSPVRELSDRIQWVSFLKAGGVIVAIGEKSQGPFDLHHYDSSGKKFRELENDVASFRVSAKRDKVVWRKGGSLAVYSEGAEKAKKVASGVVPIRGDTAFDFDGEGGLVVFGATKGKCWRTVYGDDGSTKTTDEIAVPVAFTRVTAAAIDRTSGDVAWVVPRKDEPSSQSLLVWIAKDKRLENLSAEKSRYSKLGYLRGYLRYYRQDDTRDNAEEHLWRNGDSSPFVTFKSGSRLSDGSLLIAAKEELLLYEPKALRSRRVAGENAGYGVSGSGEIIFSGVDSGRFQLLGYDRQSGITRLLTAGDQPAIEPTIVGSDLFYATKGESGWILNHLSLLGGTPTSKLDLDGYDLLHPSEAEGKLQAEAYPRPEKSEIRLRSLGEDAMPRTIHGSAAPHTFRLQSLAAAAAYDGDSFRYFISGFADNLFSDRGVFINSVFLEDAQFGTVGYSNLTEGLSYSLFYSSREGVRNAGLDFSKDVIFDRYRQATLFSDFEFQGYGDPTADTEAFVDADTANRHFYVFKTGAVYAYDITVWDRHGPISGNRFYFKTEAGYDTLGSRLANVDGNIDFRLYNRFLPRFGLAHRLVGGTSQGNLPNVFLLGGNISFRGVSFDDLQGQNYWVVSEDLRLPIFDFVGAKFFDPLDRVIGFLTRYFDVRGGIYADVGEAWFNEDSPDLRYSVGYFLNIPTVFGFVFRFNQGFAGEDSIGIWLGLNW